MPVEISGLSTLIVEALKTLAIAWGLYARFQTISFAKRRNYIDIFDGDFGTIIPRNPNIVNKYFAALGYNSGSSMVDAKMPTAC